MSDVRRAVATMLLVTWPAMAWGNSTYPILMGIRPVAVRTGATTICEIRPLKGLQPQQHADLYGTYQVFVSGQGVIGRVLPPEIKPMPPGAPPRAEPPVIEKVSIAFTVDAEATPGEREVRLATPLGSSTLVQIVVVRDPIVSETADNNTSATAQSITLPATICGCIEKAEDVDVYKFTGKAGSMLTFHAHAGRLEDKIQQLHEHCDLLLTLRGPDGTVVGSNDNYFAEDPLLHVRLPRSGTYSLEVRDVRYQGEREWCYAIEANDRPFAVTAYPLQAVPGTTNHSHPLGFGVSDQDSMAFDLPSSTTEGPRWVAPSLSGRPLNALPVVVSQLPSVLEASGDNNSPATAQTITIPAGVNGRVETPGDVDCYRFRAEKGHRYRFEIVARRVQSPLDAFLRVLNDKGLRQAQNDDLVEGHLCTADSRIDTWTAPDDGLYSVEVRDVNLYGGPFFTYFLKATPDDPVFSLELDTDKTPLSPGSAGLIYVTAHRLGGFQGEIQLGVSGLPPGVQASCGRILPGDRQGCIILEAALEATYSASDVCVKGTAIGPLVSGQASPLTAVARPFEDVHVPGGGRGLFPVASHNVSVNDPPDVRSVSIDRDEITLLPGQSQTVHYTIERRPGFNYAVAVDGVFRHLEIIVCNALPPGVKIDVKTSELLLSGSQSRGRLVLTADPDAPPTKRHQTAVVAHVALTFEAKYTISSPPLWITVAKPQSIVATSK